MIIYMPMVPEAVMAMLACARIGAIHSVVFGGFAAAELANRIEHAKPKIVITASCGIEVGRIVDYKPLLDAAIDMARLQAGTLHRPATRHARGRSRPGSGRRLGGGHGRGDTG